MICARAYEHPTESNGVHSLSTPVTLLGVEPLLNKISLENFDICTQTEYLHTPTYMHNVDVHEHVKVLPPRCVSYPAVI